ncbi:MAG: hypothetical protein IKE68_02415 [Solobacterium sp.]|nr:hypothetical protein [Solobacterium sp.]
MSKAGITMLGTISVMFTLMTLFCLYRLATGYTPAIGAAIPCLLVSVYTGWLAYHFLHKKPVDDEDEDD